MTVKPPHRRRIFGINALFSSQTFDVVPILLLSVAMHQSPQRRIGLNHRRIDSQVLSAQQAVLAQSLQRKRENLLVNLQPQPLANHREAGMLRSEEHTSE